MNTDHVFLPIFLNPIAYRTQREAKEFYESQILNKAVDAISLPALLRSTSVTDKIPVYFRDKEPSIVSYEYTSTVASKLFNFAPTLSNFNVSAYLSNPHICQCNESKLFAMNHMARSEGHRECQTDGSCY